MAVSWNDSVHTQLQLHSVNTRNVLCLAYSACLANVLSDFSPWATERKTVKPTVHIGRDSPLTSFAIDDY